MGTTVRLRETALLEVTSVGLSRNQLREIKLGGKRTRAYSFAFELAFYRGLLVMRDLRSCQSHSRALSDFHR